MKHYGILSVMMLVAMMSLMTSCSESAKLEKAAKEQMETTFKEMARDPSSVQLSNIETVYSDDSLCILHCDFCLFLISLDSFHRVKLNCLSTLFNSY